MIKIEICSSNIESALAAQNGGAHRIELCDNIVEGGTTPSLGMIRYLKKNLSIPMNILIRPRGGDFVYSEAEFETMKEDINLCGKEGCAGVVIGVLKNTGEIDSIRSEKLVKIAKDYNMSVTFHRAFDRVKDQEHQIEEVIKMGCDRILTSGGKNTAIEGIDNLKKLMSIAKDRIIILPGGGINPDNIEKLINEINPIEIHGTFSSNITSSMLYKNQSMVEEDIVKTSDINKIRQVVNVTQKML